MLQKGNPTKRHLGKKAPCKKTPSIKAPYKKAPLLFKGTPHLKGILGIWNESNMIKHHFYQKALLWKNKIPLISFPEKNSFLLLYCVLQYLCQGIPKCIEFHKLCSFVCKGTSFMARDPPPLTTNTHFFSDDLPSDFEGISNKISKGTIRFCYSARMKKLLKLNS